MNKFIEMILDMPKTLYFNFYYFPFSQAIKLPIRVSHRVKVKNMGGNKAVVLNNVKKGGIKIGVSQGSYALAEKSTSWWNIAPGGKVIFGGSASMSKGIQMEISQNGILEIGDGFFCNANMLLSADRHIKIGNDFLGGWNCTIIDGDGHQIVDENGELLNPAREIIIGNHVWMAAHSSILKGVVLADGIVVGYGALVSGKHFEENSVLAGNPAKTVKRNVYWKHDRL